MTYRRIDLWITLQPFTGRRRLAVAALTPPFDRGGGGGSSST
jgi:hypothetical protein